ncbi:endolytic transglycosylase MltG [Candidatus Sulfidibacterium hydrothermale]|uniref:endolytic transglycosylase MltG n=1 Tax=Candidatus Sulfidibacterium hydrothermale TaxID=2875962 RepID=UPI001F0B0E4C|nr:endolytic transglycosylase MltG [Candidatus Sulfidibacterium hydrothermale]UBM62978.1 endolytic transglycosylase MltG [Candidatus Sulfidibacterium hydrothermale]
MAYYHSKYARGRKKRSRFSRFLLRFLFVLILLALAGGYFLYKVIEGPNVWTPNDKPVSIYVPTGANFQQLKNILYEKGLVIHRKNFEWWAKKKKLPELVKPGRYILVNGMSNNQLVDMLRAGKQVPVNVTFNNVRDIYQLAGKVGHQIEADSAQIVNYLTDSSNLRQIGADSIPVLTFFIPNTYRFYWNTTAKAFVDRMIREYHKFWNPTRMAKAKAIGLTPTQVIILASIVEKETNKNDEKPKIASVYINRLRDGWRLQADPTVIYALGNPKIHRVLNIHKKVKSPYNTYLHRGLPPGPICVPSIASIDAVLNYDKTHYLYFCAKSDMSGYHVFSETNRQHQKNAKKYQEALDKLRIYR